MSFSVQDNGWLGKICTLLKFEKALISLFYSEAFISWHEKRRDVFGKWGEMETTNSVVFPSHLDKDLDLKVNKLNSTIFSSDSLPDYSQILCQHICLDKWN